MLRIFLLKKFLVMLMIFSFISLSAKRGEAATSLTVTSSSNPSTYGASIKLSSTLCGMKNAVVSYYYGTSFNAVNKFIGSVQVKEVGDDSSSITWTPPSYGTYYFQSIEDVNPYCQGGTSQILTQVVNAPPSYQGYINPKYMVVGVTYAPPGPSSYVQYASGITLATTTSTSSTFIDSETVSEIVSEKYHIAKVISGTITYTNTDTSTQQTSNSSSITLSLATQMATKTAGTPNAFSPVNHDYDIIWLWLNPALIYTFTPDITDVPEWNGYGYDATDQPALDIWPVYVGYLNGHFGAMNASDTKVLARSWAANQMWPTGEGPALTQSDYAQILKADPFSDNSYSVVLSTSSSPATTTDGRYTISGGSTGTAKSFIYQQALPGSSALNQTYQNSYSSNSTLGESSTTTTQEAFSIDTSFSTGTFWAKLTKELKYSQQLTWTNMASTSTSTTSTSIDNLSITGPPCATTALPCVPAYTGPAEFNVYQDNIYGTFMFNPVN